MTHPLTPSILTRLAHLAYQVGDPILQLAPQLTCHLTELATVVPLDLAILHALLVLVWQHAEQITTALRLAAAGITLITATTRLRRSRQQHHQHRPRRKGRR